TGVGHVRVVDRGDRAGVGRGGSADMHCGAGQVWMRRPPPNDQLSQVVSLKTTITCSGSRPIVAMRSISVASSCFFTFTLRPADQRISMRTKSAPRGLARSG